MKKIIRREPDFEQFLKVLKREGKPAHLPFYEHLASGGFIADRTGTQFEQIDVGSDEHIRIYMDFWLDMGYDCIPMERPFKLPPMGPMGEGKAESHGSEAFAIIKNRRDFEDFPWPDESEPIDFFGFEKTAKIMPDGVKIVAGVAMGPYEWASRLMGTVGMSYLLSDDPELVGMVFDKIGRLIVSANKVLAGMDGIGAQRQGDDLGFNTATFLPPDLLRKYVFPVYKKIADIAHAAGRPFILHSCGNLGLVYEDIIACGIDAKHSYEDNIIPVGDFKKLYGDRITPLGGLDVDFICRSSKEEIRRYTIDHIEKCYYDGYWALGTGNSLTDYMPVENYITVLETGVEVIG